MHFNRKVIDSHFHFYKWDNPYMAAADAYIERTGIATINVNALPGGYYDVSNNIMAALYKLKHPEVYAHGGLTYTEYPVPARMPEGFDPLSQYRELMAIGFDGIKMLEAKPTMYKTCQRPVDDPLYEPFFAAIEADGTHMVWHVNDPEYFWERDKVSQAIIDRGWFYGDGSYPTKEQFYQWVFHVLDRHPNLNVTFAHFFFLSNFPERLENEVFAKYPNVNVDLTPGGEMYDSFGKRRDYFRDFFIRHADRIEYGTDSSDEIDTDFAENLSTVVYKFLTTKEPLVKNQYHFDGIALDDATADKILWQNFVRRTGSAPKPICKAALKAYIAKYHHLMRDPKVEQEALAIAETL